MNRWQHILWIIGILLLFNSCSTKKNTWTSRTYHNITSEFNVKFNASESFKQGVKKAESHQIVDYNELLPVFIFADEGIPGQVTGEMERTIDKSNKLIANHSITAKPKKKPGKMTQKEREFYNKREYNSVVDDAYLLSAKASLYLQNYDQAITLLEYLLMEFPKESAVIEAKIWLAVTLTYIDELERVGSLLRDAGEIKDLSKSNRSLLNAAYANYYIKLKKYSDAADELTKALKGEKRKANKIRYHFILAHIYQLLEQPANASTHLEQIIKSSNNYEEIFSARLLLAGSYDPASGKDMRKTLLRMLADEKNKDFEDRIYFALSRIEKALGNDSLSIDYLQKSVNAESSSPRQKGFAYEVLGDYYYNHRQYPAAYTNLDLAAQTLGPGYSRYEEIYDRAFSLKSLAENWRTVHREDSLQQIAKLPPEEREKIISEAITQIIEAERKEAEERQQQQYFINQQEQARYSGTSGNTGKWYFYNTNSINAGQAAFNMRWGKRRLEDNWRRRDRSEMMPVTSLEELDSKEEETAKTTEVSNKSREYYTRDLPLTPETMKASNDKLRSALFKLGEAYMNDVNEKQLAIETFEDLNKRFPNNEFLASTYFYLYKLYADVGNNSQSEHYKQLLIANYPKEPLTQLLINPNYLHEQQAIKESIEARYEEAFNLYNAERYTEAAQVAAQINQDYPENLIQPQIALLRAFTTAKISSTGAYKQSLADLISQYPNSEAASTAGELLAALDANALQYTSPTVQQPEEGQIQAPEAEVRVKTNYVKSNGEHYYAILFDSKNLGNELMFTLESYNVDHFLDQNYEVSILDIGQGYSIAVVKPFAIRADAVNYALALNDNNVLSQFNSMDYRRLLITPENLDLLTKTHAVIDYLEFFNTEYLKDVSLDN
jgi:tetratricopeptide (TPR) repeat protein